MSKHYLITGGAGFIGSNVATKLMAAGHKVTVVDNFSTGRTENIVHLEGKPGFTCLMGDIEDGALMYRASRGVDFIIHFAAALGVKLILERPVECIETNVAGTKRVLEIAAERSTPVLVASTSEVYGKSNAIPFQEDGNLVIGPTNKSRWSYAASKMLDEFLALAYYEEKNLPVIVTRFFNTVGPRQNGQYGMVLPNFVKAALKNEPIVVHGTGRQTRCFCDVEDCATAVIKLIEGEKFGQVVNVGNTEEVAIGDLAQQVKEAARSKSEIVYVPYEKAYRPGYEDMMRRVPSILKLYHLTGFTPEIPLHEIIERTVRHLSMDV